MTADIRAVLGSLVHTHTPGATIPYSWCIVHRVLETEDATHCAGAEPDSDCRMAAVTVGDLL